MIDTNVSLSRWPFRRLPLDETSQLVDRLQQRGVAQAWAGSFDSLLHRDLAAVNLHLAGECHRFGGGLLLPFGAINPTLPDWQEDLARCHEQHGMRGIRLYPAYHGYTLGDGPARALFEAASARRMIIQLVIAMEDDRTQHPLHRTPSVSTDELAELIRQVPESRVVILNGLRALSHVKAAELARLGRASETGLGRIWFDIATQESVEGVAKLVEHVSPDRVVFGSNAPLFYFESAELKLIESGLPESVLAQIRTGNAEGLLAFANGAATALP